MKKVDGKWTTKQPVWDHLYPSTCLHHQSGTSRYYLCPMWYDINYTISALKYSCQKYKSKFNYVLGFHFQFSENTTIEAGTYLVRPWGSRQG